MELMRQERQSRPIQFLIGCTIEPASTRAASFDHLIGAGEQRSRHFEAKRLRGLQVDDHFELRRLLNGKIRRISALQGPVDVGCGARLEIRRV
jgi:hypothetical protein